ncbi:probable pectinesterase/pectinesterase inhibitor 21 [Durio zibethinus]|uniref:Pectinesterase n=1 Tax=Durio zibethinus TaxID=66656 RepID=A0A6P5Z981_DURZI|nr:probable pectinesterase/pectinesterase inhibitor 21 [Durio zibethinus]
MGQNVAVISICSVFLVAMVVAVAVGVNRSGGGSDNGGGATVTSEISTSTKAVKAICQPTDYKESCEKSLSSANTTDPKELIRVGFQAAISEIEKVIANSSTVKEVANDPMARQALDNCNELMDYAIDDLKKSFDQMGAFDISKLDEYVENLKIWLGGAITYQQTCLDGFMNTTGEAETKMKALLKTSQELTSNGLAMVSEISSILNNLKIPNVPHIDTTGAERRLLSKDGFPSWVSSKQRLLLQHTPATIKPNVVVAKDRSGKYSSINEALKEVPKNNPTTFVIYIKAGVYNEQVLVNKSMSNVMFIGDGPIKTIITGRLNYVDGTGTFKTATVGIVGEKFMAKGVRFENTAGAIKHQAVALRVQSDQSIFYDCQMDGYQDTLYAHSHRQYYRDCTISGTIDFIFGDSAAVFQNCKIIVRKPLDNQQCIVTAQGRIERREVSALVLQNCTISGAPDYLPVKNKNRAYLGRPWKEFSRTIVMQSQLDDIIDPEGWLPWNGDFALDTLFYAEFGNRGPGAVQTNRVKWSGIKKINEAQAQQFTAGVFLRGGDWIPQSGVPYTPGMIPGL